MSGAQRIVVGLEAAGVTVAASVPDTWIGKLMATVRESSKIRRRRRRGRGRSGRDHHESSGGQTLPSASVDRAALARGSGGASVERMGDAPVLRAAFPRARVAKEPALLVVDVAFDPNEPIPPYSERPDEIRARFRIP